MNRVIKHWFGVIRTVASVGVFVIGLAASTPAPALSQTYTLTDLGTLDGGPFTEAFGLNANAQIVGTSALKATIPSTGCPPRHQCVTHPDHAFSYSAGTMKDLGTLGVNFSWGTAVNSAQLWLHPDNLLG